MSSAIEIKNVGKKYRIMHKRARYTALRDILGYAIVNPLGYAKSRAKKILGRDTKEEFWALRNIDLEVKKGEVIGIIGKNGAGKSTLLKILTGITPPTEGEIRINGKVASLLEVGTGFHPELTGRENIYLNGAILGMTKREIEAKFDNIVEFSGIEQFLDTPVKRYSSGMYVRLAFSVAAHLEPDILLVDEVLAVGDAEFQKKCLGKMDEVTHTLGRTILFVSHNMDAVNRLCKRTIWLDHGKIAMEGETGAVIEKYLASGYREGGAIDFPVTDGPVTIDDFSIRQLSKEARALRGEEPFTVSLGFATEEPLRLARVGVAITNAMQTQITETYIQDWEPKWETLLPGRYSVTLTVPARILMPGDYEVRVLMSIPKTRRFFEKAPVKRPFTVHSARDYNELSSKSGSRGFFLIPHGWDVKTEGKRK